MKEKVPDYKEHSRNARERAVLGMTSQEPKISVLMSVFNGQPYLKKSVRSILNQTFEDFEFIIINDGSNDGSKAVLERFADRDNRVRLVHQENRGLVPSLNRGLSMARGRYIARMDADDISLPERLETQVRFLDSHSEVGIVGTQHIWIDGDGEITHYPSLPTDPSYIAWRLLFEPCIVHPSIMARRSLMQKLDGYMEWAKYGEDYELWTRAVLESRVANLSEVLIKYRRWEGEQVTKTKRKRVWKTVRRSAATYHRAVLGTSADEDVARFLAMMSQFGIRPAVRETQFTNFGAAFEYICTLYSAYKGCSLGKQSDIRVRQAALARLDTMANKIAEKKGWLAGIEHKLRARLMSPTHEVIPWIWEAIRRRTL